MILNMKYVGVLLVVLGVLIAGFSTAQFINLEENPLVFANEGKFEQPIERGNYVLYVETLKIDEKTAQKLIEPKVVSVFNSDGKRIPMVYREKITPVNKEILKGYEIGTFEIRETQSVYIQNESGVKARFTIVLDVVHEQFHILVNYVISAIFLPLGIFLMWIYNRRL